MTDFSPALSVASSGPVGGDSRARVAELKALARQVRGDVLHMVAAASGGHVGGPFSAADILVALYFEIMRIRPEEPDWPERDRFVLSKGHSAVALYATLAARGFFGRDELLTFDQMESRLQAHPDMTRLPGLDMSTGSLGQGISAAVGMALGAKHLGKKDVRVFCMLGDGECQEGEVWEAAIVAPRYQLDNLIAIVDFNKRQQFGWPGGSTGERLSPFSVEALPAIWRAFGWDVREIDGHDMGQVLAALREARDGMGTGQPICVVAHTVKGKGVSFMEQDFTWHARVPTVAELEAALAELAEGGSDA